MPRPKDRPVLFEVVKREEMNRGAEARPPGPSPWRSLLSATSRLVRPGASETPTEPRTPDEPAQRTDGPAPAASRTDAPTSRSTAAVSAPARPSLTPRAVAAPRASGAADASRVRSPLRYAAGRFQLEFGWIGLSGALLAMGSSVIWASYWLANVQDRREEGVKLFWNFTFGFVYALLLTLFTAGLRFPPWTGLIGGIYIGIFEMGITFFVWMKALTLSQSAAQVSHLIYLSPFVSLVFIHFVGGEAVRSSSLAGLALIVGGILLQEYAAGKNRRLQT